MQSQRTYVLHHQNWSLPIRCVFFGNIVRVRPAGDITRKMLEAVTARIAELGTSNGEDCFWTVETLEAVADLLPPEFHVDDAISWVHPTGRTIRTKQPEGMEGFYEEFVASGFARNVAEAQLRYGQWVNHLFHWLMNRRQPVDLGFAILEALPVRMNWRESVAHSMLCSLRTAKRWKKPGKPLESFLEGGEMFAYSRYNRLLYWTLNVRHKRAWWKGMIACERERFKTRGLVRYFYDTFRALKIKKPALVAAMLEHASQTRRPWIEFRGSPRQSVRYEVSKPAIGDVEKYNKSRRYARSVDTRNGQKILPQVVSFPWQKLRAVPAVQPEQEDMRDTTGDVGEPADGGS